MTELCLYAIAIDEVRDMFGAGPQEAPQLLRVFAETYPAPQRKTGLLGKLGPLFKQDYFAPADDDPARPSAEDARNLVAGRFVSPDRMPQSWQIVEAWVARMAWSQLRLKATPQELEQLDLDLARAGQPAELGVCSAFRNDAQLPLRPLPGMRVGYAKHAHARAVADAIARALPGVEERSRRLASEADSWLGEFAAWADQAAEAGRPAPDLLAIYRP